MQLRGAVDLHTHLLPGVDDGVRTFDEALEQLREAAIQGVAAVACTPHTRTGDTRDMDALLAQRRAVHERLVEAAAAEGGLPRVGLGAEVLVVEDDPPPLDRSGMRINGTEYALVEVLFGLREFSGLADVFGRYLDCGHRPILAHVERYPHLRGWEEVDLWRERGVLAQVNASSLVGGHGEEIRRRAWQMVETGRADLVASDVHGSHMRLNSLGAARELVAAKAGAYAAHRLFVEVPAAIFEGASIPPARRAGV